uniref:Homeobox domain-containing protein n=1 Tax=Plectus sambesii TaxID=2011161 RepID=A0A914WER5_9BILA
MATPGRKVKRRARFEPEQYGVLEREFSRDATPTYEKCVWIAKELGFTTERDIHRVKIWFINRRQKDRKSCESDGQGRKASDQRSFVKRGRPRRHPAAMEATTPTVSSIAQREATDDEPLLVQVVSRDGLRRSFRGKVTKSFLNLKRQYAAMRQVSESQLLFVYKGRIVGDEDTPAILDRRAYNEVVTQIDVYFLEQSVRNANLPVSAPPYQPQTEPITPVEPNMLAKNLFEKPNRENGPATVFQDRKNSSVVDLNKAMDKNNNGSTQTGRPLINKARKSFTLFSKKSVKTC